MYSIYADSVCIYCDVFSLDSMKVVNPKLVLEDNGAGSLTMTLPPTNLGYETIARMTTDISVQKDGEELWAGRVLSESKDFWNNRVLCCEGELAFFNDSTQPPAEYSGLTVRGYLESLIAVHNSKVPKNRQFSVGAVTVEDSNFPTYYTNYDKTMVIFNALIEQYGGHFRVRHEDGMRYLDYLAEYPDTCSQLIQFGSNLIEFTRNWDSSEFATVIVPLGKRLDNSPIEALDAYLTVESVNDGSMYVQSEEAVAAYGWIEKTVTWDNVSDPEVLLEKAKTYLASIQFDDMEVELSALDLHYMDVNYEAVKLLDEIRVISRPHGLDRLFPVTKLEIPLDSPEQTQFKLGDTVSTSLTSVNDQINATILQKIEGLPKAHSILKEAKENATQIMSMATTGYITITKDGYGSDTLYISSIRDYTKADKLWKWNMNGLGYSKDGGKTFGLAITMDGAIVADYITTGVLNADVIRTGTLKDYGGNFILDFETGKLTMKKGSISIGEYTPGAYNFTVDEEGNLYARRGTFAGTLLAAKGTFGGVVQAEDFLDPNGRSMLEDGRFTSEYLDLYGINVKNRAGKTVLTIDENGLRFGTDYSPIVCQFSTSASGPWHSNMETNDKYRRDSIDGGTTWGSAYQFRGEDGKNGANGSDASVTRANIVRAMLNAEKDDGLYVYPVDGRDCLAINATAIQSGAITGIDIYGGGYHDLDKKYTLKFQNGLCLFSNDYNSPLEIFNIYDDLLGGTVFSSKSGVFLYNNNGVSGGRPFTTNEISYPQGTWDFSHANVKGITAVFA